MFLRPLAKLAKTLPSLVSPELGLQVLYLAQIPELWGSNSGFDAFDVRAFLTDCSLQPLMHSFVCNENDKYSRSPTWDGLLREPHWFMLDLALW